MFVLYPSRIRNLSSIQKGRGRGAALALVALVTQGTTTSLRADEAEDYTPYLKASAETMAKWRERTFGMFIHWDMSSLLGVEISWHKQSRVDVPGEGPIPDEVYNNLYKSFNPQEFDAERIVAEAQSAGMRYIVFTAKHHGGFCMFDSKLTDYKITNTAFGRDVLKELADACHAAGMGFGIYYSQPDWHHPDFIRKDFEAYWPFLAGQITELCSNYGKIDMIFFDGLSYGEKEWKGRKLFKIIRTLQPDVVINDRCGWVIGDYNCPEQVVGAFNNQRYWESCITLGTSWSWKTYDELKSPEECIRLLIGTVGGNGNLLLNVGPMPTGIIEPRQAKVLKSIGDWLKKHGESIYNLNGGPYKPGLWGASTHKGNTLYMHLLSFDDVPEYFPPLGLKVEKAELLSGGPVGFEQGDKGLRFTISPEHRRNPSTIVKLTLRGDAGTIEPLDVPSRSLAKMANVTVSGNPQQAGNLIDDNPATEWQSDRRDCWVQLDLRTEVTFDRINIREEGNEWEERTKDFELQYKSGNEWVTLDQGNRIGHTYSASFSPKTARLIRLKINDAGILPRFSEIQVLYLGAME